MYSIFNDLTALELLDATGNKNPRRLGNLGFFFKMAQRTGLEPIEP